MQHPFNPNLTIKHAEENHIAIQRRHAQAGRQVLATDIAKGRSTYFLALGNQPGDETPRIGSAVFGDVISYVDQVLPRLR
ncbi:MAG: hypothetical protein Q8J96_13105 [Rhodocyclaceae bacterium]|nr:hypothetical protein [Rhodocyclaceae bacterium]